MLSSSSISLIFFSTLLIFASCQDDPPADDKKTTSTEPPTTTEACIDQPATNCADLKDYCDNDKFAPMLKQFCPVTCNMCPGATTVAVTKTTLNPNCMDMSSNCKNWVHNGFCTNSFYKCEDRVKYCAKSCGLCYANPCGPKLTGFFKTYADDEDFESS